MLNKLLIEKYGTDDIEAIIALKSAKVFESEAVFKGVGKSFDKAHIKSLCEARGIPFEDGDEKHVIEGIISTETVDRSGDIVIARGIDFTDFRKNPVVVWCHNDKSIPVGMSLEETVFSDGAITGVKSTILIQQITDEAKELFELLKKGVVRAFSIRFMAKGKAGVRMPTQDERRALGMKDYGVIYTQTDVHEITICPIPANQEALVTAVAKMRKAPEPIEDDKEFEMKITEEQLAALIEAGVAKALGQVEKSGAKYSKSTKERIKNAYALIKELHDDLGDDEEAAPESKSMSSLYTALSNVSKSLSSITGETESEEE